MIKKLLMTILGISCLSGFIMADTPREFVQDVTHRYVSMSISDQIKENIESNTYGLGLNHSPKFFTFMPTVNTTMGAFTAGHCMKDLVGKYKEFGGKNSQDQTIQLDLIKQKNEKDAGNEPNGLDYALFKSNKKGTINVGDSSKMKVGDIVYTYSMMDGWKLGTLKVIQPNGRFIMTQPIDCGESGAGMYNSSGELIGLVIGKMPANGGGYEGVALQINNILNDIGK